MYFVYRRCWCVMLFLAIIFLVASSFCLQCMDSVFETQDLLTYMAKIRVLRMEDVLSLKCVSKNAHKYISYKMIPDDAIQSMSFDLCSKIIINAAHNNDVDGVKKCIANNYDQRIEHCKLLGLPNKHSDDEILRICRGEFTQQNFSWLTFVYHAPHKPFLFNIVERAIDPNIKDQRGDSLLHAIARATSIDWKMAHFFELWLRNEHVNINEQNKNGDTALHLLLWMNKDNNEQYAERIISLLCHHNKIKFDIQNSFGETTFDIARRKQKEKVIEILSPFVACENNNTHSDNQKRKKARMVVLVKKRACYSQKNKSTPECKKKTTNYFVSLGCLFVVFFILVHKNIIFYNSMA